MIWIFAALNDPNIVLNGTPVYIHMITHTYFHTSIHIHTSRSLVPKIQMQASGFKLPTSILEATHANLEILYNIEICHLQLKKHRFICLSSKFYYKSGQWSDDFITVVRVHKPFSYPLITHSVFIQVLTLTTRLYHPLCTWP